MLLAGDDVITLALLVSMALEGDIVDRWNIVTWASCLCSRGSSV